MSRQRVKRTVREARATRRRRPTARAEQRTASATSAAYSNSAPAARWPMYIRQ